MNSFITGLFTLLAALSSIWLKDHLDQKKANKSTRKRKAVRAYMLCGRLMHSLTMLHVICANLVDDKNYPYMELFKSHPDTSSATMEKLELLIIENFYDLYEQLLAVEGAVNMYGRYLLDIITNVHNTGFNLARMEFDDMSRQYTDELVVTCHKLRTDLMGKQINRASHPNLYVYLEKLKVFIINFFKKNQI